MSGVSETAGPGEGAGGGMPQDGFERSGRMRWLVRGVCLVAAVAALLAPRGTRSALWVPALSPWVAAASLLATRTLRGSAVVGLLVGAIALVSRRWFCRWACPSGLCADAAGRLGRRLGCRCRRVPPLGPWIAVATLAGACLGYPLLLWLDPLAIFSGFVNACGSYAGPAAWWCAVGLPAVLLVSVLLPGAWCARICPLGAVQDLVFRLGGPDNLLSGCRRHKRFPQEPRDAARPGPTSCPGHPAVRDAGVHRTGRRLIVGAAAGMLWAAATRHFRSTVACPLRPPGAIDPWNFVGACTRCGNCIRACPARILGPDLAARDVAGILAPVLRFQQDYCREGCTRCMDVCPSGALRQLSAAGKRRQPIGLPRVNMSVCLLGDDRECAVCRNCCPLDAITLVFSPADYVLTPRIDPQKCSGCGACECACPTSPRKAIVVEPAAPER